jgi:hypothetical protein
MWCINHFARSKGIIEKLIRLIDKQKGCVIQEMSSKKAMIARLLFQKQLTISRNQHIYSKQKECFNIWILFQNAIISTHISRNKKKFQAINSCYKINQNVSLWKCSYRQIWSPNHSPWNNWSLKEFTDFGESKRLF